MGKKQRIVPQKPVTKRQLSRWQRERKVQRIILISAALVIAITLAIPAYGYVKEFIAKGSEMVARVNDKVLTLEDYAKILGMRQYLMGAQSSVLQSLFDQAREEDKPLFQNQLQQLQFDYSVLPVQMAEEWIEGELIANQSTAPGLNVSAEEVSQAITERFQGTLPVPGNEGGITSTTSTTQTTTSPQYKELLARFGISEGEYRSTVKKEILGNKLGRYLADQVPSSAEQVHIQGLLVSTEDEAKGILARLQRGEDLAAVAREVSKDSASKDRGGDMGWIPKGLKGPELEQAAFGLKIGEVSPPVKAPEGYYIIKLLDKETREIDASVQAQLKSQALSRWLGEQKAKNRVERYLSSDKQDWAMRWISQRK